MGRVHEAITPEVRAFIEAQHVFFVATAPLAADGHVNASPKGIDGSFLVVDEHTVAYLDITASGAETIAHLRENGRITIMLTSFGRTPNVLRLHGRGRVVSRYDAEFPEWRDRFPTPVAHSPSVRSVVVVDVERVSDSCGYAVPYLDYVGEREQLVGNMERRGPEKIAAYRREKNARSIDGLPAFDEPAGGPPDGPPDVPSWA